MKRPLYETNADKANETKFMQRVCRHLKCDLRQMPTAMRYDFEAYRDGKLVAMIEYKRRTCKSGSYPSYMISAHKIDTITEAAEKAKCKFILFVEWTDALKWVEPARTRKVLSKGGRKDRDDPHDQEEVYLIPVTSFRRLS